MQESRGELNSYSFQSAKSIQREVMQNVNILNGYLSQLYVKKIRIINQLIYYTILLNLMLNHIYFQTDRQQKEQHVYYLWGAQSCGIFTVFFLVLAHKVNKQYMKQMYTREQKLFPLLLNCLFILVMPYSFLDSYKFEFNMQNNHSTQISDFKLNYLLVVCSCTPTLVSSKFSKSRAARVCSMNSTFNGLIFTMRSLFKQNPFVFIFVVFVSSVAIFSYAFRIAECDFFSQNSVTAYFNMIWMTVITMTTVGFGDYTPRTPIGRVVGILCMSWGVLIVSVMVVVLTSTLSLNSKEKQSLIILKRLQKKEQLKNAAGLFIRASLWRLWKGFKCKKRFRQTLTQRKRRYEFYSLRLLHKLNRNVGCQPDVYNDMNRSFLRAEVDISYLTKNCRTLINFISEQMVFTGDSQSSIKTAKKRFQ